MLRLAALALCLAPGLALAYGMAGHPSDYEPDCSATPAERLAPLREALRRRPEGDLDVSDFTASWPLPHGRMVSLQRGPCDGETTLAVTSPQGFDTQWERGTFSALVAQLVSPAAAEHLLKQIAERTSWIAAPSANPRWELAYSAVSHAEFPYGFSVSFEPERIAMTWTSRMDPALWADLQSEVQSRTQDTLPFEESEAADEPGAPRRVDPAPPRR